MSFIVMGSCGHRHSSSGKQVSTWPRQRFGGGAVCWAPSLLPSPLLMSVVVVGIVIVGIVVVGIVVVVGVVSVVVVSGGVSRCVVVVVTVEKRNVMCHV